MTDNVKRGRRRKQQPAQEDDGGMEAIEGIVPRDEAMIFEEFVPPPEPEEGPPEDPMIVETPEWEGQSLVPYAEKGAKMMRTLTGYLTGTAPTQFAKNVAAARKLSKLANPKMSPIRRTKYKASTQVLTLPDFSRWSFKFTELPWVLQLPADILYRVLDYPLEFITYYIFAPGLSLAYRGARGAGKLGLTAAGWVLRSWVAGLLIWTLTLAFPTLLGLVLSSIPAAAWLGSFVTKVLKSAATNTLQTSERLSLIGITTVGTVATNFEPFATIATAPVKAIAELLYTVDDLVFEPVAEKMNKVYSQGGYKAVSLHFMSVMTAAFPLFLTLPNLLGTIFSSSYAQMIIEKLRTSLYSMYTNDPSQIIPTFSELAYSLFKTINVIDPEHGWELSVPPAIKTLQHFMEGVWGNAQDFGLTTLKTVFMGPGTDLPIDLEEAGSVNLKTWLGRLSRVLNGRKILNLLQGTETAKGDHSIPFGLRSWSRTPKELFERVTSPELAALTGMARLDEFEAKIEKIRKTEYWWNQDPAIRKACLEVTPDGMIERFTQLPLVSRVFLLVKGICDSFVRFAIDVIKSSRVAALIGLVIALLLVSCAWWFLIKRSDSKHNATQVVDSTTKFRTMSKIYELIYKLDDPLDNELIAAIAEGTAPNLAIAAKRGKNKINFCKDFIDEAILLFKAFTHTTAPEDPTTDTLTRVGGANIPPIIYGWMQHFKQNPALNYHIVERNASNWKLMGAMLG